MNAVETFADTMILFADSRHWEGFRAIPSQEAHRRA